jgi:hypothetical protein
VLDKSYGPSSVSGDSAIHPEKMLPRFGLGSGRPHFGPSDAKRAHDVPSASAPLPPFTEKEESRQRHELNKNFRRWAMNVLAQLELLSPTRMPAPAFIEDAARWVKECLRNDSGYGSAYRYLLYAFYRYGMSFEKVLERPYMFPRGADPRIAEVLKPFGAAYEELLLQYHALIQWSLNGRLGGVGKTLDLYRGTHSHGQYERTFSEGSSFFTTDSISVALEFRAPNPSSEKAGVLVFQHVSPLNINGSWLYYPVSIGYPKKLREYNLSNPLSPGTIIQFLVKMFDIKSLPRDSLHSAGHKIGARQNGLRPDAAHLQGPDLAARAA